MRMCHESALGDDPAAGPAGRRRGLRRHGGLRLLRRRRPGGLLGRLDPRADEATTRWRRRTTCRPGSSSCRFVGGRHRGIGAAPGSSCLPGSCRRPRLARATLRRSTCSCFNKWYFDELYDWLFVRPARVWLGRGFWKGGRRRGDRRRRPGRHRRGDHATCSRDGVVQPRCRPATSTTTPSPC